MQWHTQAGNITTDIKVKIDFTLHELSATKIVTWNCHVDEFNKGRYDMILNRDILTELVLHLNLSDQVIESHDGPFKEFLAPLVDMGAYEFKDFEIGKITPEESFMNIYAD